MQGAGFKILGLALVVLAFGCRTPKPNLKPETKPEVCVTPPSENRFNSPAYPKEAFNNRDDGRRIEDSSAMQATPGKSLSQATR